MYLDLDSAAVAGDACRAIVPAWTVLVPFFNERAGIADTIASLAAQTVPARLILIDNGSTDDGAAVAQAACRRLGVDYLLIREAIPGKVAALRAGLRWVLSPLLATCDADTFYPPHYLAAAEPVLTRPGCVVAGAYFVLPKDGERRRVDRSRAFLKRTRLLPRQCHTGGAGQMFRTDALRAAGGFSPDRWNYVLEDHEIIHRMMRLGTMGHAEDLWCVPSPRERDRDSIRWTLTERLLYSAAAPVAGDWFFYRFLADRLQRRKLSSDRIRERPFHQPTGEEPAHVPSYSLL